MLAVLFSLGDYRYGLDSAVVVRVVPALPLRVVTSAPPSVVGVFDYEGGTVPVVDLVRLATGRPARAHLSSRFILVRHTDGAGVQRLLGLLAERVNEVRQMAGPAPTKPAPEVKDGIQVISLPDLLPGGLLTQLSTSDVFAGPPAP